MAYLLSLFISFALLGGFVALRAYEDARGTRLFAPRREALDARIAHLVFLATHIDFRRFIESEARRLASVASHALATWTLSGVRGMERFLTRVVRALRARQALEIEPRVTPREFIRTLSAFKGQLQVARPIRERTTYTIG